MGEKWSSANLWAEYCKAYHATRKKAESVARALARSQRARPCEGCGKLIEYPGRGRPRVRCISCDKGEPGRVIRNASHRRWLERSGYIRPDRRKGGDDGKRGQASE